jgi:hypothetical protein
VQAKSRRSLIYDPLGATTPGKARESFRWLQGVYSGASLGKKEQLRQPRPGLWAQEQPFVDGKCPAFLGTLLKPGGWGISGPEEKLPEASAAGAGFFPSLASLVKTL